MHLLGDSFQLFAHSYASWLNTVIPEYLVKMSNDSASDEFSYESHSGTLYYISLLDGKREITHV